jgi:hypothetical protein
MRHSLSVLRLVLCLSLAAAIDAASAGELIGIRWNPGESREEFGVINTTTGAFTFRGAVGNLATWSGQSLQDGPTVYVLGNSAADVHNLYVLDSVSGATVRTVPVGSTYTYYMGGVNRANSLIVIYYDSVQTREEFGEMLDKRELSKETRRMIELAARAGTAARAVIFAVCGVFAVRAAVARSSHHIGDVDDALGVIREGFFGPFLLALMGAGFIAYGIYQLSKARYQRVVEA